MRPIRLSRETRVAVVGISIGFFAFLLSGCALSPSKPIKMEEKQLEVVLCSPKEIRRTCGQNIRACCIAESAILLPSDRDEVYRTLVKIYQYPWGRAPCNLKLACYRDGIIHMSFRSNLRHARLDELGQAVSEAVGLVGYCDLGLIGHEFMHVLGIKHPKLGRDLEHR